MNHASWIELNYQSLYKNVKQYQSWFSNNCAIAAVVKANAYGHGIEQVGIMHDRNQLVTKLCTINTQEALQLRKAGVQKSILALGYNNACIQEVITNNIELTISDQQELEELNDVALKIGQKALIHLKVDTGMSRLGIPYKDYNTYLNLIDKLQGVQLRGIYSHFSNSKDNTLVTEQEKLFQNLHLPKNAQIHIANSLGSLQTKHVYHFARVGIGLYGYLVTNNPEKKDLLQPVLSLKSKVIHIKSVKANSHIGYQRIFTSVEKKIAILSIGYFDGLDPNLAQKGYVLVDGQYAPIMSINMNLTTIDVTHIPQAKINATATILGVDQYATITAYDWEKLLKKNIRECFARLETTLPRIITNMPPSL